MSSSAFSISQSDARKYKQQSEWLNQVAWQLSVALGDVRPDDERHDGNLADIMERAIPLIMVGRSVTTRRRRWWRAPR